MAADRPLARCSSAPPAGDVSPWVGLVGLCGLGCWLALCRFWPQVVDGLGLAAPRAVMNGPDAALLGLLCAALPMAAWQLLVDKVHRRPSTGLQWQAPRRWGEGRGDSAVKLLGLWSAWALIGAAYWLGRWYGQGPYLFAMRVIGAAVVPLMLLSIPYVLWLDRHLVERRCGAWHLGALLLGRAGACRAEALKFLRGWAVKGFFSAFMLSIVPGGFAEVVSVDWGLVRAEPARLAGWLTAFLFMVDVQIGTVGYLFTLRPLDAHIRSANPHLDGWLAALICYPPFVLMNAGGPLDYHAGGADWGFWLAGRPALAWGWGAALVGLTAIYAAATLAFGIRFSNLTWRGTITCGPYRWCRHPAYLSKNLFWWGASLPFLVRHGDAAEGWRNAALLGLTGAVYWWRAKTEERHLL
ncbi:MAG TPA: protein-S-isoprenylcysteine methyltransferase, partial [Novosphingobium sp.]|nr:protein-S-isoprenylcysteine methyltransferase [Novosphingobium sp.]